MRRSLLVLACLLAPAVAAAHPAPFSYVYIVISSDGLVVLIVMYSLDIAHDLHLPSKDRVFDTNFVHTRGQQLTRLALSRFSIVVDGRPVEPIPIDVSTIPERRSARVRLRYAASNPARIDISCQLFP